MYGNQYRYGIEVVDQETGIFIAQFVVNEPYEMLPLMHTHDSFKVVVYRQDDKGLYHRSDDFVMIELQDLSIQDRQVEFIKQLNLLADKA